ncbi:bifunctional aspartate transaminase/aspartate 4-decarboxylase [Stackebrandtia nassauensis]|uniref:Aminotransferase class I and II n=1 Tax=Stackebrandtia nassauensis (strain DSM 44728 / CIP 108903 / NRRL B-16338 / NBRC 102104 / LLR-40K-21) TaxID=446470 RepID=D3PYR3_STANL|nr:bifunctional aspartate transaminase/aspartate 4-decarboxylase [Stackebrandtia nassauensis]ADD43496.1 aminotransferase class I and II [Stackebrandtia nassauensis DSM 44728]
MTMMESGHHTARTEQKRLEGLSPFELKDSLISLADDHQKNTAMQMINAGRGNPNWIAVKPREAFFLLGNFGIAESRRDWSEFEVLGGMPQKDGIAERFRAFLNSNADAPGADLLRDSLDYGVNRLGFDADAFVHELADAVIGDQYPVPDRMLTHFEKVVHAYLVQEMCAGQAPAADYDLFAVEGGTAAMCYIFDSCMTNKLLHKGDKIAIMSPIFTPYLEIPHLERYQFDVVELNATRVDDQGFHTWQYPDSEIDKLADPGIRALFCVNPSNPPSVMLARESMDRIASIVNEKNPELTVITDDVYGTFVDGFRSLMSVIPKNTIGVYSFSKYFGCTGWRLGVIAVNQVNVFDERLATLPKADKQTLNERYGTLTLEPEKLRFIDRIVADSRQVALNHTAGLSLPQQTQMALFSLMALLDGDDTYKSTCKAVIARRLEALTRGLGVDLPADPLAAHYYMELDLLSWAERHWGPEFATWMRENYEPVDPIFRLAEEDSVVLLNGGGFDGPEWSVRVSLANLPMAAYERIGKALWNIGQEYKRAFDARKGG